ncbi:MAG: two-component regulator propeller domain-containing protein [Saprospiraceae bacterium]
MKQDLGIPQCFQYIASAFFRCCRPAFGTSLFLAFFISLLSISLQAQVKAIFVSELSDKDGLSPGGVMNFFQDAEGHLWICTIAGLNRHDGHQITTFISDPSDLNSLSSSVVNDITQDPSGKLWIATREGGLNAFDPHTEQFTHYLHDPENEFSIPGNDLNRIDIDEEGQLWILAETGLFRFDPATARAQRFPSRPGQAGYLQGTRGSNIIADSTRIYLGTNAGFEYYDRESGRFRFFPLIDPASGDTLYYNIYGMTRDQQGKVWFGYPGDGLRVYDPVTDTVTHFELKTEEGRPNTRPMRMLEDQRGYLWIAGYTEIWRISPDRRHLEQLDARAIDTHDLLSNALWSIFEDRSGLIWFGSPNRRAFYFDPRRELFQFPNLQLTNHSKTSQWQATVNCLWQDRQNAIWFGVEQDLYRFDPMTGLQEVYPQKYFINNLTVGPQGLLWLATEGGLFRFDPTSGRSTPVLTTQRAGRPVKTVFYAAFDHDGDLWVSTWEYGLFRIDREELYRTDQALPIDFDHWSVNSEQPNALATYGLQKLTADSKGYIWVCGNIGGISRIEKASGEVKLFSYQQGKAGVISNNYTYSVVEGPNGYIWISTNGGGLNRYDPETESFVHYTTQDGLPSNVVFDLAFDRQGLLWLNTLKGISCFEPKAETFTHFNEQDGLQCWTEDLHYHAQTNTILAAGEKGINFFSPSDLLNVDKTASPVTILAVSHIDSETQKMKALKATAWASGRLALSHRESPLRLQFAVLDFRNPDRHRYRYSLTEGNDPEWVDVQTQNTLDLAHLDPGNYILRLQGQNSDGRWNELPKPLTIIVHPPIWKTTWALSVYLLLFSIGFYYLYRFILSRQLAKSEAKQTKAMEKLRSRFYTNITHEFRTPLTVILGIAETTTDMPKAMQLIRRNGQKLLHLINQLLDLSKLDNNALQPHYQQIEVVSYSQYIGESYQSLAEKKQIKLSITSNMEQLWMDMDEEMYRQILSNLLTNAIKFTAENGKISLYLEQTDHQFALEVQDNGIGIPAEALPHIFDRFYQVDNVESRQGNGTGIGLALVKELVSVLEGKIAVESNMGRGTIFNIHFPIRRKADKKEEGYQHLDIDRGQESPIFIATEEYNAALPSLLLIDDNVDVVIYIQSLLQTQYNIQTAPNGAIGIEKAIKTIPDIIISDVMMPEKDGFGVVETLKQDERTSHIPIILLTARATQEDRIKGLKFGADAYLMKPFDKAELFIRLEKLVALRQALQAHYAKSVQPIFSFALEGKQAAPSPSIDDLFLQKIRQTIDEKITDADLDIPYLCKALGLSSTQLFRKMKALTGESPMSFIRKVRLHRAKDLLLNTDLSISEIAYDLGFSDPNYFSRAFGKEFGCSPSAVRS